MSKEERPTENQIAVSLGTRLCLLNSNITGIPVETKQVPQPRSRFPAKVMALLSLQRDHKISWSYQTETRERGCSVISSLPYTVVRDTMRARGYHFGGGTVGLLGYVTTHELGQG